MLHKLFSVIAIFTLLLTAAFTSKLNATDHGKSTNAKDIVETALDAGTFTTLATALTEAGLVDALKGDGPFTVFAPNDEAFKKLPKGTLESLLKDKEALKKILLYHVVSGNVSAKDVVKLSKATTLSGQDVKIKVTGKTVKINNSKVIAADVKAKNGVIHVIDTVLIPHAK
jgi:uncharacterized surface protein with fasciclin (FAS1) repeats